MIQKFRKRPVVIEAYQITRELLEAILFDEQPYPSGLRMTSASYHKEDRRISYWFGEVVTIHNQKTKVVEGDWIITEPDGIHHYPCKPDIFEQTYDMIQEKERIDLLMSTMEIIKSGYAGILSNGNIVDRRKHPEAIPCQENPLFNTPKPKDL